MKSTTKVLFKSETTDCLDILSYDSNGNKWIVTLPPQLKAYQGELELLLSKVFTNQQRHADNLQLAQQLSLNWCLSKCRKAGINLDESWC